MFMSEFYKELRAGSTRTKAHQAAIRKVRERYVHPFYWGPFILVGKV